MGHQEALALDQLLNMEDRDQLISLLANTDQEMGDEEVLILHSLGNKECRVKDRDQTIFLLANMHQGKVCKGHEEVFLSLVMIRTSDPV